MVQKGLESYISIDELCYNLLQLQTKKFSGTIELDNSYSQSWKVYFYLGRLIYITGGKHTVRRWIRYVKEFAPQVSLVEYNLWAQEKQFKTCWEYEILSQWNLEGKIEREQARTIVQGIIQEVFFDWHRKSISKPKIRQQDIDFSQKWTLMPLEMTIEQSNREWKKWQEKGVGYIDPEKSPVINRKEELAAKMAPKVYENMVKLLSSQSTLWELADRIKKPALDLAVSLLPYFHSGFMELVEVEDWLSPEMKKVGTSSNKESKLPPLIACIDDSTWLMETLSKQVEKVGWRFIGIQEPLKSIPILLANKPDVILLDLKMPVTNGYELCEIMRKISVFKKIPIIILTGQDGIIDRVRAKMVGATDFISKSTEQNKLIEIIAKYVYV